MSDQLALLEADVYGTIDAFARFGVSQSVFEKEAGFACQLLTASEYIMRVALQNRASVINAVTNVAAIGVSLNPAKRQAYLVPRDGKICLDISYMGLMDLAIQSGSIMWGQAEVVYSADKFQLNSFDKPPTHTRDPFSKDRGEMVGVYVVVKTRDGDYLTCCMNIDEVFDIRDRSTSWQAYVAKGKKCPWATDEGEMVKKTVIKRAYKTWPKTDRLDQAIHFLNTENEEGLAVIENNPTPVTLLSGGYTGGEICGNALASLSVEVQAYMRELAIEVQQMSDSEEYGIGLAFDRIERENLDNDQRLALWGLLPSGVRTALKKEREKREKEKVTQ